MSSNRLNAGRASAINVAIAAKLLFKCPFLIKNDTGDTLCSIYENRPKQCAAFPIDKRCLSEVDFDCTYTFLQIEPQVQRADT